MSGGLANQQRPESSIGDELLLCGSDQATPIIDFHSHFIGPRFELRLPAHIKGAEAERLASNLRDPANLLASIEEAGVSGRVVSAPTAFLEDSRGELPPDIEARLNEYLAELMTEQSGKVFALATVDAFAGEEGAKQAESAVQDLGFRGVFVESSRRGLLLNAAEAKPTLAVAAALGVPVFVHPVQDPELHARFGQTGSNGLRLARGTINAASLTAMLEGGVFEELPDLQVVVTTLAIGGIMLAAGIGGPPLLGGGVPSGKPPHIYIDTMDLHPVLVRAAIDLLGSDRVLLGTDWPINQTSSVPERLEVALKPCGLDKMAKQSIAGGNALRLLQHACPRGGSRT